MPIWLSDLSSFFSFFFLFLSFFKRRKTRQILPALSVRSEFLFLFSLSLSLFFLAMQHLESWMSTFELPKISKMAKLIMPLDDRAGFARPQGRRELAYNYKAYVPEIAR